MNTAILLGAGSSQAAGFPSTDDLTKRVLSGQGVIRHTDSSYYIDESVTASGSTSDHANSLDHQMNVTTSLAKSIVQRLYTVAKRYYATYNENPAINYEELYYLVNQAFDDYVGEMENPAIQVFTQDLKDYILELDARNFLAELEQSDENDWGFYPDDLLDREPIDPLSLCKETRNYIADTVWRDLSRHIPESLSHLETLVHVCQSDGSTSISTLCHDNHVEGFLKQRGLALSDGFSEPENGVRYWKGEFSKSEGTIPFLKLHGSVDWFLFRPDGGDWYAQRIGIAPPEVSPHHTETPDGKGQIIVDGRPLLLIGTFNKISQYSSGIFLELHHRFRAAVNEADRMVVCGYGFRDKRINEEIIDWIFGKRGRRLVIIHPDVDSLVDSARGAIRKHWETWQNHDLVTIVGSHFECISDTDFLLDIT